jgi:hypothetical protein
MADLRTLHRLGWTSAAGGKLALADFAFEHRGGTYHQLNIQSEGRKIEVTVSPTGRSVRVFVDGVEARTPVDGEAV